MTNTVEIRELSADEINAVSGGFAMFAFAAGIFIGGVIAKVTLETQKGGNIVKDAATVVINTAGRPK